jgi:hypothetical protein
MKTRPNAKATPLLAISLTLGTYLALSSLDLAAQTNGIAPPAGMVAWWPGDGNANDLFGTNHGILIGGATASAVGEAKQAFDLNGTSAYVEVLDSPSLDFPGSITIEMWVMPYVPLSQQLRWVRLVDKNDGPQGERGWCVGSTGAQDSNPAIGQGKLMFQFTDAAGNFRELYSPEANLLWPYQFSHIAITYDHKLGEAAIYVNGEIKARNIVGSIRIPNVSNPLHIGAANYDGGGGFFRGSIDEVTLYRRALGSNEIATIYAAGAAGKCKDPLVAEQPNNQIGYWGQSVSFSVIAKGTSPLYYQWLKAGVPLANATNAVLTLSNLQATNSGAYSVTVSNAVGAVTTTSGMLSVSPVEMNFALYPGILISGVVGQTYGIQSTTDLGNTNSWAGITNITLTTQMFLWHESQPATQPARYYRVVPGPITIP